MISTSSKKSCHTIVKICVQVFDDVGSLTLVQLSSRKTLNYGNEKRRPFVNVERRMLNYDNVKQRRVENVEQPNLRFGTVAPHHPMVPLGKMADSSIDEQMIPFTGRVAAKQFIRSRPNPEGVKVFARCSADGMAHDFELYQGKGTGVSTDHSYLGLGGSVVMRLVEHLPQGKNVTCYMDNYFSSLPLFRELKALGILSSGTIRSDRLQGYPLKSDKELKKEGRKEGRSKKTWSSSGGTIMDQST
ncbi:hypothetical protein HPB47_003585 [Ixodes persulcatus]|uniref:Uncharacterized protein n=1 Tax=Ixodes persulcatus TaxID=34615 RepID=A0AC60PJI3_IXOPE|nr:hypothetical protein HPB47_003585 [Ixodes persulcatus]